MSGALNNNDDDFIAGINVTPLVDVVLVLLIIFLITAPVLYQTSIKVHLAQAATGESTSETALSLSLTKSGELSWNSEPINWQVLERKLRALGDQVSEKTALISADRDTPHGNVVQLIDTLRKAGLTHLALTVEHRSP